MRASIFRSPWFVVLLVGSLVGIREATAYSDYPGDTLTGGIAVLVATCLIVRRAEILRFKNGSRRMFVISSIGVVAVATSVFLVLPYLIPGFYEESRSVTLRYLKEHHRLSTDVAHPLDEIPK